MGLKLRRGRMTYKTTAKTPGYTYKNCARCGKYNGTMMKLCSTCRKQMR